MMSVTDDPFGSENQPSVLICDRGFGDGKGSSGLTQERDCFDSIPSVGGRNFFGQTFSFRGAGMSQVTRSLDQAHFGN